VSCHWEGEGESLSICEVGRAVVQRDGEDETYRRERERRHGDGRKEGMALIREFCMSGKVCVGGCAEPGDDGRVGAADCRLQKRGRIKTPCLLAPFRRHTQS